MLLSNRCYYLQFAVDSYLHGHSKQQEVRRKVSFLLLVTCPIMDPIKIVATTTTTTAQVDLMDWNLSRSEGLGLEEEEEKETPVFVSPMVKDLP